MSSSIIIKKVDDKKSLKKFIDFPHALYEEDPNYVPMLYLAAKELLSEDKNPFFEHSIVVNYLAYRGDEIVGRISAIRNNNYNDYHGSNVGFFGFYDVIDDYEVSRMLFDKVEEWMREQKLDSVLGPANFNTNDTAGLLIDGFDSPPVVEMVYNKPYYFDHITKYGFIKEMDLYAYIIYTKDVDETSLRLADRLKKRLKEKNGITFRSADLSNFKAEVAKIKDVYNKSWEKNWGFVPATDKEFHFIADTLKFIVKPEYISIAERNGQMIGFALVLPNINEITKSFKKGRLSLFNIIKLIRKRRKTKYVRVFTLGVMEEYRKMGVEAVFYSNIMKIATDNNIIAGEASWILENNEMMNRAIEKLNGKKYKTYRMFSKKV